MRFAAHTGSSLRRRQRDQPIGLHSKQRYPARHILPLTVRFGPVEQFTDLARQRRAFERRVLFRQPLDRLDVLSAELPPAVDGHVLSNTSARGCAPAEHARMAASLVASMDHGRNLLMSSGA